MLEGSNYELVPRLPVYPQYYDWLPPNLHKQAQKLVRKKLKGKEIEMRAI